MKIHSYSFSPMLAAAIALSSPRKQAKKENCEHSEMMKKIRRTLIQGLWNRTMIGLFLSHVPRFEQRFISVICKAKKRT